MGYSNVAEKNQSCEILGGQGEAEELYADIRWSLRVHGTDVYQDPSDSLKPADQLKQGLFLSQDDNMGKQSSAQVRLYNTPPDRFPPLVRRAIGECKNETGNVVAKHFQWVWNQRDYKYTMWEMFQRGDYPGIRNVFRIAEQHDSNVKGILYCYGASVIKGLVLDEGDPGARPAPRGIHPDDPHGLPPR